MARLFLIVPVFLAACTAPQQQAATCYRIVENVLQRKAVAL